MDANTPVGDSAQAAETLQPHPAAEIFPEMTKADFDALVADIKQNGLIDPIVTYQGTILDGRHRYRACLQIGMEPITTEWNGTGTPEAYAISKNLLRRHLSDSQRGMTAARLSTFSHGGKRQDANLHLDVSRERAAELLKVSPRTVATAAAVVAKGAPELIAAVDRGDIAVSTAARLVTLPKARQAEIATAGKLAKREARKAANRIDAAARRTQEKPPQPFSELNVDPDFQAEAEAAARDIEIERDERIATSGAGELADENTKLTKQVSLLTRRISGLLEEAAALKQQVKIWKERALSAGWEGRQNA